MEISPLLIYFVGQLDAFNGVWSHLSFRRYRFSGYQPC